MTRSLEIMHHPIKESFQQRTDNAFGEADQQAFVKEG